MDWFRPDIGRIFERRTVVAVDGVSSLPNGSSARIHHGSVLKMPFRKGEFSTIICSPPYGDERNGVSYNQFSKNMLYWLGVPKSVFDGNKKRFLGWHRKDTVKPLPGTSPTLKKLYREFDKDANRDDLAAFYHDYDLALREMVRVTHDKIAIVIGNRVLGNRVINNAAVTTELLAHHNMKITSHTVRHLPSKRIPKFGKSNGVNGGCIDREDVLVYSHMR